MVTSPPYFNLKDYGVRRGQIGFGQKYDQYLSDVCAVLNNCYDLSSEHASLWLILDTYKTSDKTTVALPFDISRKLKHDSKAWQLRDVIVEP